jgi:exopolyphosphatase / guanosine-5'-triphosphate,3'-diphosphate pyrophosphatase
LAADDRSDRSHEVAAVDLGSNSFHAVVAREQGAELHILDRLREPVRIAAGLEGERLSEEAQRRALVCLERFGQRLKGIPRDRVRIVGTKTLRKLRREPGFMRAAHRALGHEIEIISGLEEARLVYAGVTHGLNAPPRRLVVDIGGGSSELIIGKGAEPRLMESVALGCVVHTQRFFGDGEITEKRFRRARMAARVELEFLEDRYRKAGWEVAVGASGTVRGAWRVMRAKGWVEDEITREGLEKTVDLLIHTGHVDRIDYADLRDDRRAVFAGGLAVLAGIFDSLRIERMQTSENALREGVLYDLLGRLTDRDIRGDTVGLLAQRYGVDLPHAADIEATALKLLDAAGDGWKLERKAARNLLSWAARLHECGLVIAHSGYHKHSEYLVRHSDLPGFSQTEQRLLSALVRLHRGKFAASAWADLPEDWLEPIQRLAVLLRIAVLLHRSRRAAERPRLQLAAGRHSLEITFPKGWLEENPLTAADLEIEADYLKAADFKLKFE